MREVTKSAKTIGEAVETGLKELGLDKDEVEIDVVEEPSKGLFGLLGTKEARVRIKEVVVPEKRADRLLQQIFTQMKLDVELETIEKDGHLKINISGPDLGILIGRRGETLDALQYYINLAANKDALKRIRFILDVEGYRRRREETLCKLALRMANKAKQKGRDIVLEPMGPHERRVIHTALQNHRDVFTYSEGEEPYRKIIIAPKKSELKV